MASECTENECVGCCFACLFIALRNSVICSKINEVDIQSNWNLDYISFRVCFIKCAVCVCAAFIYICDE